MNIVLNQKSISIENESMIPDLLIKYNLNIDEVIVIINDKIVKKSEFKNFILKEGDIVELINFVGGG